MTLTEARKMLERYRRDTPLNPELEEAIDTAISVLPRDSGRPPAKERLNTIRRIILDAEGFDPFETRSRNPNLVCWRQCVWLLMAQEGYRSAEIARASGYDHATILLSVRRVRGYLACGDRAAIMAWEELNQIING